MLLKRINFNLKTLNSLAKPYFLPKIGMCHSIKRFSTLLAEEEAYFHKDMNEVLALDKISELFKIDDVNNDHRQEYKKILDLVINLNNEFNLDDFKLILDFIQMDQMSVGNLLKDFETIFVKNLTIIDTLTKTEVVLALSKGVYTKSLKFDENNWYKIFQDFLAHLEHLPLSDISFYMKSFENIKKYFPSSRNSNLGHEMENFLNFQFTKIFNTVGKDKFEEMEDLVHLSQLIHLHTIRVADIHEDIWRSINKLVCEKKDKIDLNYSLVICSLYINYYEATGGLNVFYVLEESVLEVSNHIIFLLNNFDLLNYNDQVGLTNFSDTFFFYFKNFMFSAETGPIETSYLQNLLKIYTIRLKGKDDFKLFQELRIIHFISKKLNYRDTEFWNIIANKTKKCLSAELLGLAKIFSPKLLKNSSPNTEIENPKLLESELSLMFHSGLVIDTFSSVGYSNMEFWEYLIKTIDQFCNFKIKEHHVVLQYVIHSCKNLYTKDQYIPVWEAFCQTLEPQLREILKHRDITSFLVRLMRNNQTEINVDEMNMCFNKIFIETGFSITQIKMYSNFFNLFKHKIFDNEKCLRLTSNILVDIIKISKNKTDQDNLINFYSTVSKYKTTFMKMTQYMKERVINILKQTDEMDEEEIKDYFHLFRKLIASGFMNKLDIVQIKFQLEKESLINESKSILFERILKL